MTLKSRMVPTSSPDRDMRRTLVAVYIGVPIAAGTSESCICSGCSAITSPLGLTTRIQFTVSF